MFRNITPVVKNLLIINIGLLLLTYFLQSSNINLVEWLGLFYFKSEFFKPYQFVTHMFMHGGFVHLLFNMYALFLFGVILEQIWGSKKFLFYYLFTGLGAAALHTFVNWFMIHDFYSAIQDFLIQPDLESFKQLTIDYKGAFKVMVTSPDYIINNWEHLSTVEIREYVDKVLEVKLNIPTVGASGAVFGLLLAFGVMFPNAPMGIIFLPFRIKAKWFVIAYGVLELVSGVSQISGDNIAHFAHLGGMIFGFILLKIWYKGNLKQN